MVFRSSESKISCYLSKIINEKIHVHFLEINYYPVVFHLLSKYNKNRFVIY